MILALLLSLVLPVRAQELSSGPVRSLFRDTRLDTIEQLVREVRSGNADLTGTPTFRNGANLGGSTFAGDATFSGSITNTGSVTNSGNVVHNASTTFNGGVFGNVHITTRSVRGTGISWGSSGLVSKSTLTVIGSTITIHANIHIRTSGAANIYAGYLIDGRCPSSWTCSGTCTSNQNPWGTNNDTRASMTIDTVETVAHGSHTVSIWACADSGTTANGAYDFRLEAN